MKNHITFKLWYDALYSSLNFQILEQQLTSSYNSHKIFRAENGIKLASINVPSLQSLIEENRVYLRGEYTHEDLRICRLAVHDSKVAIKLAKKIYLALAEFCDHTHSNFYHTLILETIKEYSIGNGIDNMLKFVLHGSSKTLHIMITEQAIMLPEGQGAATFVASNGFVIGMNTHPAIDVNFFNLKGSDVKRNDVDLAISFESKAELDAYIKKLNVALNEFSANNYFIGGKPTLKFDPNPDFTKIVEYVM